MWGMEYTGEHIVHKHLQVASAASVPLDCLEESVVVIHTPLDDRINNINIEASHHFITHHLLHLPMFYPNIFVDIKYIYSLNH